jgi:hypothetical protein
MDRNSDLAVAILTEHYRKTKGFIASRMNCDAPSPPPAADRPGFGVSDAAARDAVLVSGGPFASN